MTLPSPAPSPIALRDVLTFGETMLRLSPAGTARLASTSALDVWVAGSESNVAAALAALGVSVTWVSRLPSNALGRKIADMLRGWDIGTEHIVWTDARERVGLFFLEPGSAPRPTSVIYDRAHSAASRLVPADISDALIDAHRHLHVSGITPALSASCAQTVADAVARAKSRGKTVSLDVNFRALLWTPGQATEALSPLWSQADVVFCTREDAARLFGLTGSASTVAAILRRRFAVPTVVLTTGADGAVLSDDTGEIPHPAVPVPITLDRLGSGDAFAAGFLAGWLAGSPADGLKFGVAAAALKRTIAGDVLTATRAEIEAVMQTEEGQAWR